MGKIRTVSLATENKYEVVCYEIKYVTTKDVDILTPVPVNVTLFSNKVFADVVKIRSLRWILIQYDWCFYKKGTFGYGDRHTGGMPRGGECRDQGDASVNQWRLKIVRKHQWLGKRPRTVYPSKTLESEGQPVLLTPWFQSCSLQNWETLHFCCLTAQFFNTLLGSPTPPVHGPQQWSKFPFSSSQGQKH